MTWHPPSEVLEAYGSGRLSASQVWSVEAHVTGCQQCHQALGSQLGDPERLEAIWDGVIDRIDAPRPRLIERFLVAVGVPEHLARLLGATPSLTVPWLVAVAAVLGFGLVMAWNSAGGSPLDARAGLFVFLLVAPLVPLAGVAVAFGPVVDPAYEVAVATPFHGFRLLLIRTVAVVSTSMAMALVAALALPGAGLMTAAWIVPSLALAGVALALSTFISPLIAGALSSMLWIVTVSLAEAGPNTLVAFGWGGQLVAVAVLSAAAVLVLLRRDAFEIGSYL